MPDLWFVLGLAIGMVLMGFCTIGSFDRGADSVSRDKWKMELVARKRAFVSSRSAHAPAVAFMPELLDTPLVLVPVKRAPQTLRVDRRKRVRHDQPEAFTHVSV